MAFHGGDVLDRVAKVDDDIAQGLLAALLARL